MALTPECERLHGVGDRLHTLALQRIPGTGSPEHQRSQEQPDLVDLAGVEKRARQMRTALQQDRADPGRAELVQRRAHAGGLVLARSDDDLDAVGLQRVGGGARRRA